MRNQRKASKLILLVQPAVPCAGADEGPTASKRNQRHVCPAARLFARSSRWSGMKQRPARTDAAPGIEHSTVLPAFVPSWSVVLRHRFGLRNALLHDETILFLPCKLTGHISSRQAFDSHVPCRSVVVAPREELRIRDAERTSTTPHRPSRRAHPSADLCRRSCRSCGANTRRREGPRTQVVVGIPFRCRRHQPAGRALRAAAIRRASASSTTTPQYRSRATCSSISPCRLWRLPARQRQSPEDTCYNRAPRRRRILKSGAFLLSADGRPQFVTWPAAQGPMPTPPNGRWPCFSSTPTRTPVRLTEAHRPWFRSVRSRGEQGIIDPDRSKRARRHSHPCSRHLLLKILPVHEVEEMLASGYRYAIATAPSAKDLRTFDIDCLERRLRPAPARRFAGGRLCGKILSTLRQPQSDRQCRPMSRGLRRPMITPIKRQWRFDGGHALSGRVANERRGSESCGTAITALPDLITPACI